MGQFQHIVMVVAVVILIISLLILAVMLWRNRFSKLFPPVLPGCPDYWEWVASPSDNASECHGWSCNKEGQTCPASASGAHGQAWCCKDGLWGGQNKTPGSCATNPDGGTCNNTFGFGSNGSVCNSTSPFTSYCRALAYAQNCGVTWDGVTNNASIINKCTTSA
jgi:hypothetical protein